MKIWIVYVPDADRRGPDLSRMNRIEDVPDELAQVMLGEGSARKPTDEELAAYEATRVQPVEQSTEQPAAANTAAKAPTSRPKGAEK